MDPLLKLLPLLTEIDQDKGITAVMETLKELGVVRFDPERGWLMFRQRIVTAEVLDAGIRRRLEE